jgi:hypothetical protein
MALPNDQSLIELANNLNINYELKFKKTAPSSTPELDEAINTIYEQIPFDMKMDTRNIDPMQHIHSPNSYALDLLSELPRLVLDSDLPSSKKHSLLTSIKELYRRYIAD